ncbi:hypothetical protein VNO77_13473 [Canavalia gladiata]|uniref:C2 domain-containing protein n=1 Tax=Canavalia gladiata TaxID=3824 RepID=A0AAN9LXD1_CANGL
MSILVTSQFQLLEINVISAQDLAPVAKSIKAYAVAWISPERKLTTQIDPDGHNNPTWNEKFVFRIDDEFLHADDSTIMIEIYTSAWIRDVLIGTVGVLVSHLIPRSNNRKSKIRFVALQVRRPSGRPQGILNIGVNLVDATMRSMPMYSELSASDVGYWDETDPKKQKLPNQTPTHENNNDSDYKLLTLQRSQSEKNDSTINDYTYNCPKQDGYDGGSDYPGGSELGMPLTKKGFIMNANGSLCSDVGPSPSVVAAAIAKGLYPLPMMAPRKPGNTLFVHWPDNEEGAEGLNTKIDRWRSAESPPVYDHLGHNQKRANQIPKGKGHNKKGSGGRGNGGLFSCFGTAMGCEFTITCGGGHRKKRYDGSKAHLTGASELTYDESYII